MSTAGQEPVSIKAQRIPLKKPPVQLRRERRIAGHGTVATASAEAKNGNTLGDLLANEGGISVEAFEKLTGEKVKITDGAGVNNTGAVLASEAEIAGREFQVTAIKAALAQEAAIRIAGSKADTVDANAVAEMVRQGIAAVEATIDGNPSDAHAKAVIDYHKNLLALAEVAETNPSILAKSGLTNDLLKKMITVVAATIPAPAAAQTVIMDYSEGLNALDNLSGIDAANTQAYALAAANVDGEYGNLRIEIGKKINELKMKGVNRPALKLYKDAAEEYKYARRKEKSVKGSTANLRTIRAWDKNASARQKELHVLRDFAMYERLVVRKKAQELVNKGIADIEAKLNKGTPDSRTEAVYLFYNNLQVFAKKAKINTSILTTSGLTDDVLKRMIFIARQEAKKVPVLDLTQEETTGLIVNTDGYCLLNADADTILKRLKISYDVKHAIAIGALSDGLKSLGINFAAPGVRKLVALQGDMGFHVLAGDYPAQQDKVKPSIIKDDGVAKIARICAPASTSAVAERKQLGVADSLAILGAIGGSVLAIGGYFYDNPLDSNPTWRSLLNMPALTAPANPATPENFNGNIQGITNNNGGQGAAADAAPTASVVDGGHHEKLVTTGYNPNNIDSNAGKIEGPVDTSRCLEHRYVRQTENQRTGRKSLTEITFINNDGRSPQIVLVSTKDGKGKDDLVRGKILAGNPTAGQILAIDYAIEKISAARPGMANKVFKTGEQVCAPR